MHSDLLHLQRYHQSGDAGAFQTLVRHHAGMVFATACRVTRDPSLAEDVAQETFLELARKGRNITESVGAWLHRVAWRRACDVVRAEATRRRHESAAHDLNGGRECTWEEMEPLFDEALAELAPEARTVIIEHYLEGRKQMEIAARMGLSQSSVSRLLEQSMTQLRCKLKQRGLLCGVALAAVLTKAASPVAPDALAASLHKIAISSIGSGVAGVTAGGGLLSGIFGVKSKLIVSLVAVLAACAAGYDLASKDSRLARWWGQGEAMMTKPRATAQPSPKEMANAAMKKARLLVDAKALWSRRPKLTKADLERLYGAILYERDPEKRWAAMRELGITLSRSGYDRLLERHPDIGLFDERKAGNAVGKLWIDMMATWSVESPLEAVVWSSMREESVGSWFPPTIAPWVRAHPEEWQAFVEAGPDPRLGDYARLWVEDLDDPGSLWGKAKESGLDLNIIGECVYGLIVYQAPTDRVFRVIMRAPNAEMKSGWIVGIFARLSDEQFLEAANSGQFLDGGLVNAMRAMAGDSAASFDSAAAWVSRTANGGGMDAQRARFMEESAGRFYAQWLKVDAAAALRHSVQAENKILIEKFMEQAAKSPMVDEALITAALSNPKHREHALAAYYQARADGDPEVALQSIMHSTFVEDQIESAKEVLIQWTVKSAPEAAAWVAALPPGDDRAELIAAVASQWAGTAPEEAFAFAQQQGASLAHGWSNGLAWGARILPEEKLAGIFAALRDDPEYNTMLTRLVGWRCPRQPGEAFALLSKYAAPGWETPVVDDTIHWLEDDDARAEPYAVLLPSMDLALVEPQKVAKAAQLFIQSYASQGKLKAALDWTLKLPAPLALQARSEAMAKLNLNDASQKTAAEQWARNAAITEAERTSWLQKFTAPQGGK